MSSIRGGCWCPVAAGLRLALPLEADSTGWFSTMATVDLGIRAALFAPSAGALLTSAAARLALSGAGMRASTEYSMCAGHLHILRKSHTHSKNSSAVKTNAMFHFILYASLRWNTEKVIHNWRAGCNNGVSARNPVKVLPKRPNFKSSQIDF